MKVTHQGMQIDDDDWGRLVGHLSATLKSLEVPEREMNDVLGFIESTKSEIVE